MFILCLIINLFLFSGVLLSAQTVLNVRVLLEGAYIQETGLMRTDFATFPYKHGSPYLYGSDPFTLYIREWQGIPQGAIDWVYIEFRTEPDAMPIARTACFLRSDGQVIGSAGRLPVFDEALLPAGCYYLVVSHRNHCAVMSTRAVHLSHYSECYDFSLGEGMAWNAELHPMKKLPRGIFALRTGDLNGDGCKNSSDIVQWETVGKKDIWFRSDFNFDGKIDSSDRAFLLNEYPQSATIPTVDNTDTPVITVEGFMQEGLEISWPWHTFDNYQVHCRPCRGKIFAEIYDTTGKLVYQQDIDPPGGCINFPTEVENGNYIVKMWAAGKEYSYSYEITLYRNPQEK